MDKRRMDELRVEVGVKESFKKNLVMSRLKWVGHVERMGDEKLAKGADTQKVEGKMRQGRLRANSITRDLERVGGEGRTTAKDRRSWNLVTENATIEVRIGKKR